MVEEEWQALKAIQKIRGAGRSLVDVLVRERERIHLPQSSF